jgi:hypothetical protein
MKLKNGLASVYLNKTPIANSAVQNDVLGRDAVVYVNGTGTGLTLGFATLGLAGTFPLLLKGANKIATGSITAGSNILNTTSAFFTDDMIASNSDGDGGLYQRVRIPGAGPNGTELEAEVIAINSSTQALLDIDAITAATSVLVTWDHFTYATERRVFASNIVTFETAVPRTDLRSNPAAAQSTWVPVLATIGNGSVGLGAGSSGLNFKNVKVHFRPGTLDQAPVVNGISGAAATGVQINSVIDQVASIDNGGETVFVHNTKLRTWWGDKGSASADKQPTVPSPSGTVVLSGVGANGLGLANPGEVDEVSLDLSFPNGLNAFKAKDGTYGISGAVFQIYFEYKLAGAADFTKKLVLGPSSAEVATRTTGYFVHDTGDLARNWRTTGTVRGNTNSNFNYQFRFSVNEFKPFDDFRIRIIKLTPNSYGANGWRHTGNSTLSYAQAYINDKLSYPLSSYLAVEYNSQEFQGSFADIAAHMYGIEVDVPTNYVTREEARDGVATYTRNGAGNVTSTYVPWGGTFRRAYCNNPVWIIRELLLNRRFGLGNWLTADQIDSYSFYAMSRYCDDLVPNGEGGFEPRFTCAAYLTQAVEAYKILKDFFTVMIAIPYWLDGQIVGVQDKPAMPVYTFSKSNVEGGIFTYEGTGSKVRPNQVAVTYNDRDYFYEQRVEIVDDIDDIVNTNRIITDEVVAFGATSRSQAIRYGRWKLLTGKMQKDIISFKTADNAIFLSPGDIITVQDADKNRVRYSGRIVSGNTGSITIDKGIEIAAGENYEAYVTVPGPASYLTQAAATISSINYSFGDQIPVFSEEESVNLVDDNGDAVSNQFSPDMHLEIRSLTNGVGLNITNLSFSSALSSAPESDFMWAIIVKNAAGNIISGSSKDYKILSITEDAAGVYTIIAAEHFNGKFDLINEDYLLEPTLEVPRYGDIPPPRNFTAGVQISLAGSDTTNSAINPKIVLAWQPPVKFVSGIEQIVDNLDSFLLKYQGPNGEQVVLELSNSVTGTIIDSPTLGIYSFTLQSKSSAGPVSVPAYAEVTVQLDSITPGLAAQLGLLRGGEFSRPPILEDAGVEMPQDYTYTSPVGTTVKITNGSL